MSSSYRLEKEIVACTEQLRRNKSRGLAESVVCEVDEYLFFAREYARLGDTIGARNALNNARGMMPDRLSPLASGAT